MDLEVESPEDTLRSGKVSLILSSKGIKQLLDELRKGDIKITKEIEIAVNVFFEFKKKQFKEVKKEESRITSDINNVVEVMNLIKRRK